MRRIVLLTGITLSVWGCLPDPLPVKDIPGAPQKIVVSSQLFPDQSIAILLTKSFGALEANGDSDPLALLDQIAINDATVVITGMGTVDTLTLIESGIYGSNSISFVDEGVYTLHVVSPSMGSITATTEVKTAVSFISVQASIYDTGFDTLATINYAFQDIPGKNHYMVNVQHISSEKPPEPEDFLNPSIFIHLTEDNESIDGTLISDSFNAIFRRDFIPGDTIIVQLANIEKGYYDFLQARKDSRFNFSDFLGEPVNYPTNITNGLGWFTLQKPDVRVVLLDEE